MKGAGKNYLTKQAPLPHLPRCASCGVDQWVILTGVSMTTTHFSYSANTNNLNHILMASK